MTSTVHWHHDELWSKRQKWFWTESRAMTDRWRVAIFRDINWEQTQHDSMLCKLNTYESICMDMKRAELFIQSHNIVMYWVSILPVENEDASWENVWQRRSSYFFLFEKIVVHFVVEHCSFNKFHDFFPLLNKQTGFTFFFLFKEDRCLLCCGTWIVILTSFRIFFPFKQKGKCKLYTYMYIYL